MIQSARRSLRRAACLQGVPLSLQHHEKSKGRVLAAANAGLHAEALALLHTPAQEAAQAKAGASEVGHTVGPGVTGALLTGLILGVLVGMRLRA